MTVLKNNYALTVPKKMATGFILMEVVMSLAVVGMVMSSIIISQQRLYKDVIAAQRSLERVFAARLFAIKTGIDILKGDRDDTKKITEQNKQLRMELNYEVIKPQEGSGLARFDDIYLQRVTYSWNERGTQKREQLVACVYDPSRSSTATQAHNNGGR